jgi:hypothetical protein
LLGLVGKELVPGFMWMFAVQLDDGAEVHGYKSIATRRYIHLAVDGRAFRSHDEHRYEQVNVSAALAHAFEGWEETVPQPKDPDAVRALLERHRAVTSREMH